MRFTITMMLLSLSLGPVIYLWNQYLIPDENPPLSIGAYVGYSMLGVFFMLILFALARISDRIEKRKRAKSEE